MSGFHATAGAQQRRFGDESASNLEKGPAFAKATADKAASETDWPTYRGDAARSGRATGPVPTGLKSVWKVDVAQHLSQCVIADGKLLVASREDHRVHALDAEDGKKLWSYVAGGRVDSVPTYYKGMVIFGARDGHVYCLNAADGQLAWKFRAAPQDQRCIAYNQVESVWPVHGSVLVHNDVLWFAAGRCSFLDGGVPVYRLDPLTGKMLSKTQVYSRDAKGEQPPIKPGTATRLEMEGAKPDILSCDGNRVYMRHWVFDLEGKSTREKIDHLFSATGFLDTTWFRRTYWVYGTHYQSGAQMWSTVGNSTPSGRIMSIGKESLYGFGRDRYPGSPGVRDQMYVQGEKELFYAVRKPGGTAAPAAAPPDETGERRSKRTDGSKNGDGKGKGRGGSRTGATPKGLSWSAPGDLQTRAMLLGSDEKMLFVAGAKGDWIISMAAYQGRKGNTLRVMSAEDGKTLNEYDLPATPVFDGMSAAGGRLYISLQDGSVTCWGKE